MPLVRADLSGIMDLRTVQGSSDYLRTYRANQQSGVPFPNLTEFTSMISESKRLLLLHIPTRSSS